MKQNLAPNVSQPGLNLSAAWLRVPPEMGK